MHPRPDWFILFKHALLRLIVCTRVATFIYTGYLTPIVLDRIRDVIAYAIRENVAVLLTSLGSLIMFVAMQFLLVEQYVFVNKEDKIRCGIATLTNIVVALVSIMSALDSGPIGMGQFWETVGQCYIWLIGLLAGLLTIALLLYCSALIWLDNESQSSGGTVDGQPIAVVVIAGKSTTAGTHGTLAAPETAATPGSTAASSAI